MRAAAIRTVLILCIAGLLAFFSTRFAWRVDFSAAQRGSLSAQSVQLLTSLDHPVEVVSWASRDSNLRGAISDFLARYREFKSDIELRFVDPDSDPAAAREQGVRVDGELEIRYGDRSERLKQLSEREFTNALLRLSRDNARVVAYLTGDGERKPDGRANADFGSFGDLLAKQGIRFVPVALGEQAHVPEQTNLLVIANPQVPLTAAVVAQIVDFVDAGGHLLWLTEPNEQVGLDSLAQALSLRVLTGTVVDGAGAALNIGDPSFVAMSNYPPNPITRNFDLTTLLPQAAALGQLTGARWDIKPLLRSGAQSWTETGAIPRAGEAPANVSFDANAGEIRGPLDLAFALSRLSPRPGQREQRVVVIGDGDFLSNSFLGNGGNREFGQRLFNWLLADDALIEIADRGAPDRSLELGQTGLALVSLGFLIVLPLLLLCCGGLIWWRRRRR
ncbi:MAG: DUF4350 domain-containing protein [Tahibacter sp.]